MPICFAQSISKLETLPLPELHLASLRSRNILASAEWEMCVCLLAWKRRGGFHHLGYSSLNEYAEKALHLSEQKVWVLLATARALERLPLVSMAYREGRLCWAKIRVLQSVVTPETEADWLKYAQNHRADQVANKVTQTPREWKQQRALEASLAGKPIASAEAVAQHLSKTAEVPKTRGPRKIRLRLEMTPDQFALYEAAERLMRAREGKRIDRAAVIARMAEAVLDGVSPKSRPKHQVLIHTTAGGKAWYQTKRGNLPVSPEVLRQAKANGKAPIEVRGGKARAPAAPASRPGPAQGRRAVPAAVLAALFARAEGRCERCGSMDDLDVHHKQRVSEGGQNSLDSLELVCGACHRMEHRLDFENKPHWGKAKARTRQRSQAKAKGGEWKGREPHCEDSLVPYKQQRKLRREYETGMPPKIESKQNETFPPTRIYGRWENQRR